MKKRSEVTPVAQSTKGGMQPVREAELSRIRGGAGNAAIDFAIKLPG